MIKVITLHAHHPSDGESSCDIDTFASLGEFKKWDWYEYAVKQGNVCTSNEEVLVQTQECYKYVDELEADNEAYATAFEQWKKEVKGKNGIFVTWAVEYDYELSLILITEQDLNKAILEGDTEPYDSWVESEVQTLRKMYQHKDLQYKEE